MGLLNVVTTMNESAESVSLNTLSVTRTIRETLEICWQHRKVVAIWIVGCTIFTGGLCFLMENLFASFSWIYSDWKPLWIKVLFFLLSAIPFLMVRAMFSVFCHRLVLMDAKRESLYPRTFGKREWQFIRWDLTLSLCAIGIVVLVLLIFLPVLVVFEGIGGQNFLETVLNSPVLAVFIAMVFHGIGSYFLAPYCLVLPATAVDLQPSLAWSSEQAKGNELSLAVLFGGLPFVFGFLYCPPSLLTWLQIDQLMFVKHVSRPVLVYLVTPVIVIAMSIAFRELTNWTPSAQLPQST